MRDEGGRARQGVMKGAKTAGSRARVVAIAAIMLARRVPVRDQAVWRAGWRVRGQFWEVLTVMMDFSAGMWE